MSIGIGISMGLGGGGVQNAPVPTETYFIANCLYKQHGWTTPLAVGTLRYGQRVPTTSDTVTPFYGTIQDIGTEVGPLTAIHVENIYYDCSAQTSISIGYEVTNKSTITFFAFFDGGGEIRDFSGSFRVTCNATWFVGDEEFDQMVDQIVYMNYSSYGEFIADIVIGSEGNEITVSDLKIYYVDVDGFYNYGDAQNKNSSKVITPQGDLWNWFYHGPY